MKCNYNIYVIYDKVAQQPIRIFIFENDRLALRFFESALHVPNSPLLTNVKDTICVCVGSFDDFLDLKCSNSEFKIDSFDDFNQNVVVGLKGRKVDAYDSLVNSLFIQKED